MLQAPFCVNQDAYEAQMRQREEEERERMRQSKKGKIKGGIFGVLIYSINF